ncbi:MAG TPA: protein kinase [Myxococcales bacterium]|nr:protein kinase [Myxococcales bacterium]
MDQERVGEYRLIARIATGGMAELFLGRREGLAGFRKTVAIKRLLPHLTREPQVVQMFLNEARIASRLEHPNVVQVFDLGQSGQDYFMAMEFLDGRTLAEVLEASAARGELVPLGITVRVLADACAGLHYAHEARDDNGQVLGVIHRDFNPANVFITYDGRVKVLDFGIAKVQSLSQASEPGVLRGKYYYMSPEMVTAQPMDRRADLFACGVMLYEILAGKLPFQANDVRTLVTAIAVAKVSAPSAVDSAVPPLLDELCLRLLRKDPAGRPPTADAVKGVLEQFLSDAGQSIGAPELSEYMERLFPPDEPNRRKLSELRNLDPTPGGLPLASLGAAPLPVARAAPEPVRPARPTPPAPAPAVSQPEWTGPRRSRLPLFAGLGAVALLVAGGGWFLRHHHGGSKSGPASPSSAAADASRIDKARKAFEKGKLDDARDLLEKTVADDPKSAAAHLLLGQVLLKQRYGQKAEAELRLAIKLEPKSIDAYRSLADLKLEQGDVVEAGKALEAARRAAPDNRDLVRALAQLYGQRGEWKEELPLLEALLKQDPKDAAAWADEGFARFNLGEDERAAQDIGKAEKLDPTLARAYYYEGFVDYKKDSVEKAVASYRKAADMDKKGTDALLALGDLYKAQNDDAKAKGAYQEALLRDPQNAAAKSALGMK